MIEREELDGMALEAVVVADRKCPSCVTNRQFWVIGKGVFLVMDMMRLEACHTVALSVWEFRGGVLDENGNRIQPRQKISLDEFTYDPDDPDSSPVIQLKSVSSPPWSNLHNQQLRERFERALDRLPDQRAATAFRLIVWDDWTHVEVAKLFGVTSSRVSQLLTRARVRLCAEFFDLTAERRAA